MKRMMLSLAGLSLVAWGAANARSEDEQQQRPQREAPAAPAPAAQPAAPAQRANNGDGGGNGHERQQQAQRPAAPTGPAPGSNVPRFGGPRSAPPAPAVPNAPAAPAQRGNAPERGNWNPGSNGPTFNGNGRGDGRSDDNRQQNRRDDQRGDQRNEMARMEQARAEQARREAEARNFSREQNREAWRGGNGPNAQRVYQWRDYDRYRVQNFRFSNGRYYGRTRFNVGAFYWPRGFASDAWLIGGSLPSVFFLDSRYEVPDYWRFGLYEPPVGCHWVRVGGDALLVDDFNGEVLDGVYDLFW